MKKWGSIGRASLVLILAALTLAGCGRRAIFDRASATATEAITIDMQAQPEDTAPQQETNAQAEEQAQSAAQAATQTAQPPADATDAELIELMDELEAALDELDEAIEETDSDSLTDAALAALG